MLTLKVRILFFAQKSIPMSNLQSPLVFNIHPLLLLGHGNSIGPKVWAFNIFLCFIKFLWRLISLWHDMAQNNLCPC